jgi:hypothetical protein
MLVSRRTIYSFLLGALLGLGLRLWAAQRIDDCTPYFRHEPKAATSMLVEMGGHSVAMPCDQWLPRQPQGILMACMVEGGFGLVFLVSAVADVVETRRRRQEAKAARRARLQTD